MMRKKAYVTIDADGYVETIGLLYEATENEKREELEKSRQSIMLEGRKAWETVVFGSVDLCGGTNSFMPNDKDVEIKHAPVYIDRLVESGK